MRRTILVSLSVAAIFASPRARAWCRTTTTIDFVPTESMPCDDAGKPLYWASKCVSFSVQKSASVQVPLATARALASQAFDSWSAVDCPKDTVACTGGGEGPPSIKVIDRGPITCGNVEYNSKGGNANVLVFRDEAWPHPDASSTIALTTVTFNVETGEIYDADIEINSNPKQIKISTTTPGPTEYDFLSMLTHEAGHFFGIAHTQTANVDASMFPRYDEAKTFMRVPAPDDVCAICTVAPPKRVAVCNDEPRHGFADGCGAPATTPPGGDAGPTTPAARSGGCGCAIGSRHEGAASIAMACALLLVTSRRRRTAGQLRSRQSSCTRGTSPRSRFGR